MLFTIVDKDGRSLDQDIFADTKGKLDGEIQPGRKMSGEYAVQVPKKGISGLELEFSSSFWSGSTLIVSLDK
jgi:hypothetical protein